MSHEIYRTIIVLSVFGSVFGQTGYSCTVRHTGETGVCQTLDNCRHLIADVRSRRRYTRCGFDGRSEVVCCPPAPAQTAHVESSTVRSTVPRVTLDPATMSTTQVSNERVSVLKCRDYAKAVYIEQPVNRGRVIKINRYDMCGHKVVPLIVGGEYAKEREFPHMALLGYGSGEIIRWNCGGSLISENYVLTAAHCTRPRSFGAVSKVRLGELNYTSTTETRYMEEFDVADIINHPLYRASSSYNDIALLRLDHSITMSPFVRPACLPTEFQGPQSSAIATGWGTTDVGGRYSDTLQKVTLQLFEHHECQASYYTDIPDKKLEDGIKDGEQLCAGSRTMRRDTCQGDSGGPLQIYRVSDYCTYTIIGVTSFGAGCGEVGVPGIYTRVFSYLDWIESIVWS